MIKKIKLFYLAVLFLVLYFFTGACFAYSELDGRWIELHGPYCWKTLGVAQDEQMCDLLNKASSSKDKERFLYLLESFRVLRIAKNTKAVVMDMKVSEGKVKVLLLTGFYRGQAGWIPISWLDENESRPLLNYYKEEPIPQLPR